jgi:hypothetical protein
MDDHFIHWLAHELTATLATPMIHNRRLHASRVFITAFIDKLTDIPAEEWSEIRNLLRSWEAQRAINGVPLPRDKATLDWLEAITGTIDGIIDTGP